MERSERMVKVWDPVVRVGHWALAAGFILAYFSEDDFLTLHVWAGYAVGAIICLRLAWGFVGSTHARFRDFVRSPTVTLRYLADLLGRRAKRYLGHNPAGGAMVVVLLLALAGTVSSGLMLYAIEENAGPLAGWATAISEGPAMAGLIQPAIAEEDDEDRRGTAPYGEGDREEFWEEIHEILANMTLFLVGLHIAGVLYSSYQHRENLVLGMISGRKRRD